MKKFAEYIKENHIPIEWPKIVGTDLMKFYTNMQATKREKSRQLHDEFLTELKGQIEHLFQENGIEIDSVTFHGNEAFDFTIQLSSGQDALVLAKQHAIFSEYRLYTSDRGKLSYLKSYGDLKDFFKEYFEEMKK